MYQALYAWDLKATLSMWTVVGDLVMMTPVSFGYIFKVKIETEQRKNKRGFESEGLQKLRAF